MRDATVLAGLAGIVFSTGLAMRPAQAQDPVLRDVEVRSFLGEPLNLRIALAASTETAGNAICQAVIDSDSRENALRSSDLMLTMVELRDTRYLQVRSRSAYLEPIARFSLRIGCPGEPIVDREFTVLLDPPPFTALVVSPAATAATIDSSGIASAPDKSARKPPRAKPVVPPSGVWTVYEGDTVTRLAKGIHPKNRARRQQYITVLRELNPHLAAIADDAPLAPGTQLALPDLLTLSGIMPRAVASANAPSGTPRPPAPPAAAKRPPAAEKSVAKPVQKAAPTPAAAVPAPPKTAEPRSAPPAEPKATPPARPEPAKPSPSVKAAPRVNGFQLRLSGSEMDLTRSRNVTDEQRRALREKQLMLDSDDQLAAFLSLRNTVKQLEQRLNVLQLKMATATAIPAKAPATVTPATAPAPALPAAPASATVAAPAATSPTAKPPSPAQEPAAAAPVAVQTPSQPPSTAPAAVTVTPPTTSAPAPAAAPEKTAQPEPSLADTMAGYLPSSWVTGGIVAGLFALLAAWAWLRREGKSAQRPDSVMPPERKSGAQPIESMPGPVAQSTSTTSSPRDPVFSNRANEPVGEEYMQTSRREAVDFDVAFADSPPAPDSPPEMTHAHHQVDAPVVFDDTPARYEVDSRPATTVDFLIGMDEKLPEDRVRRLQYMRGRYPELQANTISIDDADGVINAARLYYDDADKGNGRDKACELLTFAVEERPQEIRFWLAQFEIFRLENMAAEFTAMASKFHVLFSHTPAWPKVRHIGHELDPGNPLFAASGGTLLAGETRFDPIAENWLNAPMDFTSDALMSDLRLALLDAYGVSRTDFESITARLSATPETASS